MIDRDKVIRELECIRDWSQFAMNKHWLVAGASEKMVRYAEDALEFMKAQEPVEPIYNGDCEWDECPNCGYVLSKQYNPCPGCGRPVKWNAEYIRCD